MNEKRYFVDQLYVGCFEVRDCDSGLVVARCPYYMDAIANDKEITDEARDRAEGIANALNLMAFNWRTPVLYEQDV